ncbi:DUF47 family protein [Inquilinus sp. KBS0705]|nr:DUF47 family protein [Inquilinus sp. KBS0705]
MQIEKAYMAAGVWGLFIPKNQQFFNLFNQSSTINVEMSQLLYKAVSGESKHEENMQFNQIDRLKLQGNDVKHKVYLASAKAFISPFARNDMYALASALNSVCDHIHVASRRIHMYQSDHITPSIKELSSLVLETSIELDYSVKALNNLKNSDAISALCNKIKQLEHYADTVYSKAVSLIMANEKSSVELIKYTEILGALEKATDRCEDATKVIESIIIKNK